MPTITEQTFNTLYERAHIVGHRVPGTQSPRTTMVRGFGRTSATGETTIRATANTPAFDPAGYAGEVRWTTCSQERAPEGSAGNPTPVAGIATVTSGSCYYDATPTTPHPGETQGSGTFAEGCRQAAEARGTEEAKLNEFRRWVRDARNEASDSGYSSREYVRGLTNGELVNAAKAYEYLRPELWPFNGSRRFDAHERSDWNRMARAVAFLKLEQWRIGGDADWDEQYADLEHEIRRLEFKAVEQRWPRQREQDTEIDPF